MLEQFNQIKDLKLKVKTALDLAQAVAHLNGDERVQQAIDAGRLVLDKPTRENRRNAADAVDAAYDAAYAVAAAAAVDAVDAAADAAYAAAYAAAAVVDAVDAAYAYAYDAAVDAAYAAAYAYDAAYVAAAVDAVAVYAAAKGDKRLAKKLGSIIQTALESQEC